MTDPHEIIEAALADAYDIGMTDALCAKAVVLALEAAGIRLLSAEGVTEEMVRAFVVSQTLDKPWEQMLKDQIVAAIRAAPVYSKEKL